MTSSSSAATESRKCASSVSSIGAWLIPPKLCTNSITVGTPARAIEHLPPLAPDQDYQLWLIDPQYPIPVDGGVFTVDPATGEARVTFKADKPVKSVAKFAVSLERKGGVAKAEGPMVLLGQ